MATPEDPADPHQESICIELSYGNVPPGYQLHLEQSGTLRFDNGLDDAIVATESDDRNLFVDANDIVCSLGGADRILVTGGSPIIFAGDGRDSILVYNDAAPSVDGGPDQDHLDYRVRSNPIAVNYNASGIATWTSGGATRDLISIEELVGTAFDDTLDASQAPHRVNLTGMAGNDRLMGSPHAERIMGGPGRNVIHSGSGADHVHSLGGDDITGTDSDGTVVDFRNARDLSLDLDVVAGTATLSNGEVTRFQNVASFVGTINDDRMSGAGHDRPVKLVGGDGNDTLIGSDHRDGLHGGSGKNEIAGGSGSDHITVRGELDTIDGGGGGRDILDFRNIVGASLMLDVGRATAETTDGRRFTFTNIYQYVGTRQQDYMSALGTTEGVFLAGNAGSDVILGSAGVDRLYGGDGADVIDGNASADSIDGGLGPDSILASQSARVVVDELDTIKIVAELAPIPGVRDADIEDWPWAVQVLGSGGVCAGSLISDTIVLTAAHCKADNGTIIAGSAVWEQGQTRGVDRFVPHPDFFESETSLFSDIALVFVDRPFDLNDSVAPVRLPGVNDASKSGELLWMSGWGADDRVNRFLQEVPVHAREFGFCPFTQLSLDIFCGTSPDGFDPVCRGDSGGGVVRRGEFPTVVGIASFQSVIQCDEPATGLAGFTEVARFVDWIAERTDPGKVGLVALTYDGPRYVCSDGSSVMLLSAFFEADSAVGVTYHIQFAGQQPVISGGYVRLDEGVHEQRLGFSRDMENVPNGATGSLTVTATTLDPPKLEQFSFDYVWPACE